MAAAPSSAKLIALAAGLSLLACSESSDDAGDNSASDPTTNSGATLSGSDSASETADWGGSEYGGPPPCEERSDAQLLGVGSNPIDTSAAPNDFTTTCGQLSGSGPDQLFEFIATDAGDYSFALTNANFEAWMLRFGSYYCYAYDTAQCVPNQGQDITLFAGETLYLIVDGTAGGTATIDVTQN